MKAWVDTWREDLTAGGYGALTRGQVPYEIAKLMDRDLVPVPAVDPGIQAAVAKNLEITYLNKVMRVDREGKITELRQRFAMELSRALRPKAKNKLKTLLSKHSVKIGGVVQDGCYDGEAMWKDIVAGLAAGLNKHDHVLLGKAATREKDVRAGLHHQTPLEWYDSSSAIQHSRHQNKCSIGIRAA